MKGRRQTMADKKTILIIDDERDMVKLLRYRLECCGYKVLAAYDGESGLKIIDEGKFDLVILDIMLPKIGGIELYKHISNRPSKIPVIIFTGRANLEEFFEDIKADAFIGKPFLPEHLLKTIDRLLTHKILSLIFLLDSETNSLAKETRRSFQKRGFGVEIIETEEAFRKAAIVQIPDFIIMEYAQKDMEGKDFIKRIRETLDLLLKRNKAPSLRPPILVYSRAGIDPSCTQSYYEKQSLEAGADKYIGSPADGEVIVSALKEYISEKEYEVKEEREGKEHIKKMLSADIDHDHDLPPYPII